MLFFYARYLGLLLFVFSTTSSLSASIFDKEWYFTWGYNRNFWSTSDIHVSQPSQGNDFTVHSVAGHDYAEWNHGAFIFDKDLFAPQFSFRTGFFFNQAQDLGFELSLDHTKFSSNLNQTVPITGTIAGASVNTRQALTSNFFRYDLHNGANPIMLNLVKRFSLLGELNQNWNFTFLAKAGGGIMLPHSDNTILGKNNNVGPKDFKNAVGLHSGWWQVNGWVTGVEAALRLVLYRPIFFELADKYTYASLKNIPVYQGTARQNVFMNEVIFSLGVTLNPFGG